MRTLDAGWSDYLTRLEELRAGIHLMRLAGRPPLDVFHREAAGYSFTGNGKAQVAEPAAAEAAEEPLPRPGFPARA